LPHGTIKPKTANCYSEEILIFFAGDEFAEEKIAVFINPDKGHKFMMYTWAGMIGSVSGLNEKGISVTINA
jgi:hypothetical protein